MQSPTDNIRICICSECATTWAIDQTLYNVFQSNRKPLYCPRGHALWFQEGHSQNLREELNRTIDHLEDLQKERDVLLGMLTDKLDIPDTIKKITNP